MADKMLIDATHQEETRVVVLRGNRVEEFDFESANRKQLRGNIYLAKVTRVEPSLQAAFVDYGGNRHGFLAFSEIHPDYYQIPVADRQALIAQEANDARAADADADHRASRRGGRNRHRNSRSDRNRDPVRTGQVAGEDTPQPEIAPGATPFPASDTAPEHEHASHETAAPESLGQNLGHETLGHENLGQESAAQIAEQAAPIATVEPAAEPTQAQDEKDEAREAYEAPAGDIEPRADAEHHDDAGEHHAGESETNGEAHPAEAAPADGNSHDDHADDEQVESVGGADALEEAQERAPRFRRNYKIQEVIKRRQVMLVQVVKEERGSKGAALTTYLSLAGRYSVLMPNTARGGGISRKISSGEDRSRLKEIMQDLEVPEGMGVILRTAGASRTKLEVKRDFEYLLRLWETVRDLTLKSMAPKLVYEEGSLTKRSIRDLYNKEIDEIVVAGEAGYREAREFMRMLMPSHAKHVKLYKDTQPLFTRYGIESQLDAMFSPTVQLRSGGYIVINQTEALVAIDVNSGRATREHHIEDTALKTNCEAADEVARQLRLRDLAGLIVIDFIDMDEGRNNRSVERRMKDALKYDRARIQVGRISHFGLLEMSRQRIRTSVLESSTEKCPVCGGSGHVRSVSSVALQLLRAVEEMLNKGATHNLIVRTRSEVALYVLNHKRAHLRDLEQRFRITITISADPTVNAQVSYIVDRGEQVHTPEAAKAIAAAAVQPTTSLVEDDEDSLDAEHEDDAEEETEAEGHSEPIMPDGGHIEEIGDAPEGDGDRPREGGGERDQSGREGGRGRRRRRGRGRGRGGEPREGGPRQAPAQFGHEGSGEPDAVEGQIEEPNGQNGHVHADDAPRPEGAAPNGEAGEEVRRRRRRGRRGGRRNRHRNGEAPLNDNGQDQGQSRENFAQDGQPSADFPPVSDEDASGIAPPFERPMTPRPEAPAPSYSAAPETPAPMASSEAPSQEAPRRRSTIREAAPIGASAQPSPAPMTPPPAPVVSSTAPETAAPKRGWWGKRLLGDKD